MNGPLHVTIQASKIHIRMVKKRLDADSKLLAAVKFFFFDQIISSPTILSASGNSPAPPPGIYDICVVADRIHNAHCTLW